MSAHSVYSYVDALNFPGRCQENSAGAPAANSSLLLSDGAGDGCRMAEYIGFTARPPFHPMKFLCFLYQAWPVDVRIEGEFWVDNAPDERCEVLISKSRAWYRKAGLWLAAERACSGGLELVIPPGVWDPVYGDRQQNLRIYHAGAMAAEIDRQLKGCLIPSGSEFLRRASHQELRQDNSSSTKEIKNVI
ncbi:MAG: cobalamin biosynthesis protein CobW [Betaproteobacteria bacterium]|nr:cobalamin biosynthesis protein CobW [Betaproteobacteria bacterium]